MVPIRFAASVIAPNASLPTSACPFPSASQRASLRRSTQSEDCGIRGSHPLRSERHCATTTGPSPTGSSHPLRSERHCANTTQGNTRRRVPIRFAASVIAPRRAKLTRWEGKRSHPLRSERHCAVAVAVETEGTVPIRFAASVIAPHLAAPVEKSKCGSHPLRSERHCALLLAQWQFRSHPLRSERHCAPFPFRIPGGFAGKSNWGRAFGSFHHKSIPIAGRAEYPPWLRRASRSRRSFGVTRLVRVLSPPSCRRSQSKFGIAVLVDSHHMSGKTADDFLMSPIAIRSTGGPDVAAGPRRPRGTCCQAPPGPIRKMAIQAFHKGRSSPSNVLRCGFFDRLEDHKAIVRRPAGWNASRGCQHNCTGSA